MKEAKSPKKGLIKPDKRVLLYASNLQHIKNIRVRPKFWRQTTHPRYNNFIIYTGWQHWKKDYGWLYLPEEYNEVRQKVLKELLEKNDKGEYKHKRLAYFVSRNRNDQMTVHFQNLRRLDLLRPTTCLFFGGKEWDEDSEEDQNASKEGRPWKEEPRIYWFTNSDYADNEKLLVEAKVELDRIWVNTGNYYNSAGYGEIFKAFIGHEHQNHTIGPTWANDTNLKEDNNTFERMIPDCSACNDCFDYCRDLRVKRAVQGGFGWTMVSQWQPKYGVLFSAPNAVKDVTFSEVQIDTGTGQYIDIPTNLQIRPWDGTRVKGERWVQSGLPAILYLVDQKHYDKAASSGKSCVFYPDYDQTFYHELPREYNEVPHLMNHSTAQFFFQKKLLFTANIRHLGVGRKITPNSSNKPIYVIHYRINTASSVSGILYKFQSGDIFFRWELDVKGSYAHQTILSALAQAFTGRLMTQVGEWAGSAIKGAIGAAANYFGLGSLWKKFTGKKDEKTKKGGQGSVKDILAPDKYKEQAGVSKTSGVNQDKKTEQNTERKSKSTKKGKEWEIESSVFATETIDFNYDFWEYANRSEKNPFMPRFEHSEVFYNNLINNSNLATAPIRSISTPFSAFKQLLTPGLIQGEITLDDDQDGFFAGLIRRGIPFIGKKKEFFKPFVYRYKGLMSYTAKGVSNTHLGQGEEIVEEKKIEIEEELGKFDRSKAIAGYTTYFRVPDSNLYEQMAIGKFSSHHTGPNNGGGNTKFSDGRNMVCWGCGLDQSQAHYLPVKAGGVIYTYFDSTDLGEGEINIPNDCTIIVDAPNGNIRVKMTSTEYIYHYKSERQETERDEEIADQEYQEAQHDPTNTSSEVDIEIEEDNEDEVDPDELEDEADGEEKEEEEEIDVESEDEFESEDEDESSSESESEGEDESESESEDEDESSSEDDDEDSSEDEVIDENDDEEENENE